MAKKSRLKVQFESEVVFDSLVGPTAIWVSIWYEGTELCSRQFSFDDILRTTFETPDVWQPGEKLEVLNHIRKNASSFVDNLDRLIAHQSEENANA